MHGAKMSRTCCVCLGCFILFNVAALPPRTAAAAAPPVAATTTVLFVAIATSAMHCGGVKGTRKGTAPID